MSHARRLTRREFLATSAAGAVAATTSGTAHGADSAIRLGLIGCGVRGMALLDEIQRLRLWGSAVQVAAVSDAWSLRRKMGQARSGGAVEKDWRALVARSDLDGVIIATPDHLHAAMTLAALENGKDVYCETPSTLTLDEAAAVRDAVRLAGRIYQAGASSATQHQWRTARPLIKSGEFGAPLISQATIRHWPPKPVVEEMGVPVSEVRWDEFYGGGEDFPIDPNHFFYWRMFSRFSDGPMAPELFNAITSFLLATGNALPDRVAATGGRFRVWKGDNPNQVLLRIEYSDGHRVIVDARDTPDNRMFLPKTRLEHAAISYFGDHLSVKPQGSDTTPFTQRFGTTDPATIPVPASVSPMANWLECMKTREPCVCNEDLAYQAMAALSTGMRALRERKALNLI